MTTHSIVQIGSSKTGWVIEVDGIIRNSHPSVAWLGAWLDAITAGASDWDATDIANALEKRPPPSYEERLAVFKPSGRPEPSRNPFEKE